MRLFSKIAYHSTSQKNLKKFNKFTSKKKAYTGEGAQVHGWGLYLQEDKEINIERYKNRYQNVYYDFIITVGKKSYYGVKSDTSYTHYGTLNGKEYSVPWTTFFDDNGGVIFRVDKIQAPLSFLAEYGYDETYNYFHDKLEEVENDESWKKESNYNDVVKQLKFEIDYLTKNKIEIKHEEGTLVTGHQYEVEIPDDFVFLDEDENLKNQNIPSLSEIWNENGFSNISPVIKTGRELYENLIDVLGDEFEASYYLLNHGIDGIKYDGRTDGQCYVIFNCARLKIVREVN